MSFDVASLAQTGMQTLVAAMATEVWIQVRAQVGRLFGRSEPVAEKWALAELDEIQTTIDQAPDDQTARDAAIELRGWLRSRLRSDRDLADQFAELIDEIKAQLPAQTTTTAISQYAQADRGGTVIQAGRDAHR